MHGKKRWKKLSVPCVFFVFAARREAMRTDLWQRLSLMIIVIRSPPKGICHRLPSTSEADAGRRRVLEFGIGSMLPIARSSL